MMGPETVREYAGVGPIHTDDRPRLEFFKGEDLVSSTADNIEGMKKYRQPIRPPFLKNYGATHAERKTVQNKIDTYFKATQKLILGQITYANAQAELAMGQVRRFKTQLESASALMNEAIRINPEDETVRYNYGVVSGIVREDDQEQLRRMQREVQQTLLQNPDDTQAYLQLAVVHEGMATEYERRGEHEKAAKELAKASTELEKLLKRDPNRPDIYLILGGYYERQGRYKQALRTYKRFEQRYSDLPAPIFAAMAGIHWELEEIDEAKKYAQKGLAADVNSWRSHYILGKVYHAMNQPEKQHEHYTNALKVIDEEIQRSSDPTRLRNDKEQIQNELKEIQK